MAEPWLSHSSAIAEHVIIISIITLIIIRMAVTMVVAKVAVTVVLLVVVDAVDVALAVYLRLQSK